MGIFRDHICNRMELSCSYRNKYLKQEDNVDIVTEGDIDEDDDIFKHKDNILKVRHLVKTL